MFLHSLKSFEITTKFKTLQTKWEQANAKGGWE